jgi:hypothetical protein
MKGHEDGGMFFGQEEERSEGATEVAGSNVLPP